jgi:O-antigen ligase
MERKMAKERQVQPSGLQMQEKTKVSGFVESTRYDDPLIGIRWFEIPLLFYFMVHFFPPMPSGIANVCLLLGTVGVLWECYKGHWFQLTRLKHPLVLAWILLVAIFYASALQVPEELLRETWRRLSSDLLKHTLFAFVILFFLDTAGRARRVLLAGMLACFLMVMFCLVEVLVLVWKTGKLPFQRDYLFYLMFFFPFSLVVSGFEQRWRYLSLALGAAALALAFMTGFRGAVLALVVMSLLFALFARKWGVLILGAALAVAGVAILAFWFPETATYVLSQFQKTHSSGRISGHWLPAWEMSMQSPWLGHGFGHHVFGHHFVEQMDNFGWPRGWTERLGWAPGSPHSVVFETLFMAGWPALFLLGVVAGSIIISLGRVITRRRDELFATPWLALALTVFISAIGNFLFFYQTEDPSWRTIPIMVMLATACLVAVREPQSGSPCAI